MWEGAGSHAVPVLYLQPHSPSGPRQVTLSHLSANRSEKPRADPQELHEASLQLIHQEHLSSVLLLISPPLTVVGLATSLFAVTLRSFINNISSLDRGQLAAVKPTEPLTDNESRFLTTEPRLPVLWVFCSENTLLPFCLFVGCSSAFLLS